MLLLISEAYTDINNYHSLRVCLVPAPREGPHKLIYSRGKPVGIVMSILQMRSLVPGEVSKSPARGYGEAELGSWSGLSDSRACALPAPTLGPELQEGNVCMGLHLPCLPHHQGVVWLERTCGPSSSPTTSTSVSRSAKWVS